MINRISRYLSNFDNLMPLFAIACMLLCVGAIVSLPLPFEEHQLYPKTINRSSTLDPYDRGGPPFTRAEIAMQYPANSPYGGYVTTYLTPLSWYLANTTPHLGTTIVAHPGGILDEILYNTRGLDTVVETTILFVAFALGSYLYRKR